MFTYDKGFVLKYICEDKFVNHKWDILLFSFVNHWNNKDKSKKDNTMKLY